MYSVYLFHFIYQLSAEVLVNTLSHRDVGHNRKHPGRPLDLTPTHVLRKELMNTSGQNMLLMKLDE